jgi:UDP-glucose 4-epimerase
VCGSSKASPEACLASAGLPGCMRVVVTGASGNVGSAVVERLVAEQGVDSVVGVCRREHSWRPDKTEWVYADVAEDDLTEVLRGVDAVVHLAWLFQPTRRPQVTWRSNVEGSRRVLEAAGRAEVPTVVVASSVGAYSPRENLDPVDESWPSHGVPQAAYSREKAYVERLLDVFEGEHPGTRVVRMRPAFIFQERASTEQRRLFMGPLLPHAALRPGRVPVLPLPSLLRLQLVHARDVADAYTTAVMGSGRGAFNLASEPVLDPQALAEIFGSRWVPTPPGVLRAGLSAAFRARLAPAAPALFDLAMAVPMMDSSRARTELGWEPQFDSAQTLRAFLAGLTAEPDVNTPPLARATSGRARRHELATGVATSP